MNRCLIRNSCVLVAFSMTTVFAQIATAQRDSGARATGAQSSVVTMSGCVVRQRDWSAHPLGSATPGGGTLAATNQGAAATGSSSAGSVNRGDRGDDLLLIVTTSRPDTAPKSAVPGSSPSPSDSGTVPLQTQAGKSSPAQSGAPSAFHLSFANDPNATSYVGQRVEVTGRVTPDQQATATDASDVARAGAATTGTRAEVARNSDSHPSADLADLAVQTIKPIAGRCEAAGR
jgi:hypothetical protein